MKLAADKEVKKLQVFGDSDLFKRLEPMELFLLWFLGAYS